MPFDDRLEMPDLLTSSKFIIILTLEASTLYKRATTWAASSKVSSFVQLRTYSRLWSALTSSRAHSRNNSSSSSSTILSVSMIFWLPCQGLLSDYKVNFGFCHSFDGGIMFLSVSSSSTSSEISSDSLI